MADAEKELGNTQFKAGNYEQAIVHFSKAIELGATHVLFSNRSACYCGLKKYDEALSDAEKCIEMNASWGKGYGRKGAALHGMANYDAAIAAYEKGLTMEPGLSMLTKGLEDAKAAGSRDQGGLGGLGNIFGQPDVLQKIASNPQTAGYLSDPSFMMKLQMLQQDPSSIGQHLSDQRIMQVMGMLMGVNIQSPDSFAGGAPKEAAQPKKPPEPEPEPEPELTEEEKELKAKKATADAHKEKGNTAYKAKQFDEAIGHYEKAIEVLPEEMSYYNNLAAVKFEQKEYSGCIEKCKKAIEVGRAARADYKVVAKSYARIGNAQKALGNFDDAIRAYEDSLMEDRTPDVEKKLKQMQAEKKKAETNAYVNPELAEAAREEGNALFKEGKYPQAIEKYDDAMKRNPKSHLPYSNRAACYQKLMEWQLALKDADKCVEMEPTFIKGWTRKAGIHFFLKEYHKAMDAYNVVLKLEPENEEAKNGLDLVISKINESSQSGEVDKERQQRAMADPEIQAILGDPQMRSILNEMQTDPKKAQAAMNDPSISEKLQKLIAAGVLQVR
mmetsp:Transcript_20597/g.50670  ORF Transcript_20597/g.50670 Transcript_20597/m.50670 type:complete len:556 (-) Transcript_20597:396-2063(-)